MFFPGFRFCFSFHADAVIPANIAVRQSVRLLHGGPVLATAFLMFTLTGCSTTQNLTLQGQITELQNQKTALQNERDAWKDRYSQLQESSRHQTQALASSAQENQALKKNQMVYQEQLRDMLARAEKAEKENQQLQERLAKLGSGSSSGTSSDLAELGTSSGTGAPAQLSIPNIQGTMMRDTPDTFHIEIPMTEIFDPNGGISPQGRSLLQKVASAVDQTFRGAKIEIQGHTSPFTKLGAGSDAMTTSMTYANIVRDFFIQERLLAPEALNVSGHGSNSPALQSVNSPDTSNRNSRIELVVTKPKF